MDQACLDSPASQRMMGVAHRVATTKEPVTLFDKHEEVAVIIPIEEYRVLQFLQRLAHREGAVRSDGKPATRPLLTREEIAEILRE